MPKHPLLSFLFAALLLWAAPASAGASDCENANTTVEMNQCADEALKAADAKLNEAYQKALSHVTHTGGEAPYDAKSWETALREAQRAWIAYRDADCRGVVPMEWEGGTGASAAVLGCMTHKTETRTKELLERYGPDNDDTPDE